MRHQKISFLPANEDDHFIFFATAGASIPLAVRNKSLPQSFPPVSE